MACVSDTPLALDTKGIDFRLLNAYQRDLPLTERPYAEIGRREGYPAGMIVERLRLLTGRGAISRVGAVFAPRRIGASTLAALAVPVDRLDEVAQVVNARAEVNHNYLRENDWNMWFVASAANDAALGRLLAEVSSQTGCPLISLPLLEEFHIDLGFDLADGSKASSTHRDVEGERAIELSDRDRRLVAALAPGLPLVDRPFAMLAGRCDQSEQTVIRCIEGWLDEGLIKRMGVVVRHHELGFRANAMCVWDVPDESANALGMKLAGEKGVSLCYRRRRALPEWRFNLFCMIHGRSRSEVEARIAHLQRVHKLDSYPHACLFSTHRFKQCGARYSERREA